MATWDGKDSSIIANRFGNVYIKDYMDISGRLFVRRDASLNSRLFVMNDASFMGNLYVDEFITENANFNINGDVSLNGRLMVAQDATFNCGRKVPSNFTLLTSDTSNILILGSDSIIRKNVGGVNLTALIAYINQTFSGNYFLSARIVNISGTNYGGKRIGFTNIINSDTPYFGIRFGDIGDNIVNLYFNGSLQSYSGTYVGNELFSIEITTDSVSYYKNNYLLARYYNPDNVSLYPMFRMVYRATNQDSITSISIGTLTNSSSTYTINGNLTANLNFIVNGDASLNSNVIVGRDISCNDNISIGRNLIVGGNLAVKNYTTANIINTTTTNYQLVIAEDLSLNGRLAVSSDTSLNGNLFVAGDISCNGNLNVRTGIFLRDISVNGITIGRGAGGFTNTIFGNLALASNSAGINNTAVGYAALRLNTGSNNTACGYNALASNTTGINNTAVGSDALSSNTTGCNNTAVGYNAGSANVDGSFNTYIGYNANADAGNYSYSTAIGANALITGSNQIVLGTSAETVVIPGKIRHAFIPNKINYGVNNQSIPASSTATLLFPNSIFDGTYVNIGYNSANGTFTNNNPYTIGVTVSASVATAGTTGITGLMLSIVSSVYGVVGSSGICGTVSGQACTNCTATFPMGPTANNETFYVTVRNTKTSALLVRYGTISGTNIMIRVF
jgi:predicted acyltransferase (DUF342 family)